MKTKWFIVVTLVLTLLMLAVQPALALTPIGGPSRAMDWAALLSQLITTYQPYVLTLLGAILADVVLGIAASLKTKTFDWQKLANFYRSDVAPGLLGWVGLTIATYLVVPDVLGAMRETVSQGVATLAWGAMMATLGGSIVKSARELYGIQIPMPPTK